MDCHRNDYFAAGSFDAAAETNCPNKRRHIPHLFPAQITKGQNQVSLTREMISAVSWRGKLHYRFDLTYTSRWCFPPRSTGCSCRRPWGCRSPQAAPSPWEVGEREGERSGTRMITSPLESCLQVKRKLSHLFSETWLVICCNRNPCVLILAARIKVLS